jgi:hypothetical protein
VSLEGRTDNNISAPNSSLEKRLQTCLRAAEDQRMDVVRALVGVDGFEVLPRGA